MFFSEKKNESYLYGYFHEFHSELMQIKLLVKDKDWTKIATEKPFPESLPFRSHLLTLIENQGNEASERGGEYGAELYRRVKYLMVALADEFFLHLLDWDGQEIWREHLLELEVFNSQSSGQGFFDQIDELLVTREPVVLELARIFLIVLALGFQGKFRDRDDAGQLIKYRQRLYKFITRRQPEEAEASLRDNANLRICPSAYQFTLNDIPFDPKKQWLPSLSPWYWAFTMMLLTGLFSSMVLWYDLSRDLSLQAITLTSNNWVGDQYNPIRKQPRQLIKPFNNEVLEREINAREAAERQVLKSVSDISELKRQLAALQKTTTTRIQKQFTLGDVSFSTGKAILSQVALERLDELALQLKQEVNDSTIEIKGYTDSSGMRDRNLRLSLLRAGAVREALISRGIDSSRITSFGLGSSNPVADNSTLEGRRKNRRVEIYINPVQKY